MQSLQHCRPPFPCSELVERTFQGQRLLVVVTPGLFAALKLALVDCSTACSARGQGMPG